MPDKPAPYGQPADDTTQPRSCAGGADLWAIREDLAHIVQQLDVMIRSQFKRIEPPYLDDCFPELTRPAVSEAEVEAAATQLHHEFGCTITAARIAAVRALDAATKVREGK